MTRKTLTSDCPVEVRSRRHRMVSFAVGVALLCLGLVGAVARQPLWPEDSPHIPRTNVADPALAATVPMGSSVYK